MGRCLPFKQREAAPSPAVCILSVATMHWASLFSLSLAALATALPSRRFNHVVHEKRTFEPIDWIQDRRLEAHKILPMRIGLTQQNLHRVEEMLMAVSHPESATYGQHLSPDEVIDLFAPSDDTINAIKGWLNDAGIHPDRLSLSPGKGWVEFDATAAEAEELLKTEYHVYTHAETGVEQISKPPGPYKYLCAEDTS